LSRNKPRGEVGLLSPAAQWELLFASKEDFHEGQSRPTEEWIAMLDEFGESGVLEVVASGRMPVEIAISNRIPMMVFREWMDKNVSAERLLTAQRSAAEVNILKSQLALAAQPANPAEAALQKELSHRYAWLAERADPEKWGPPRNKNDAPPMVSIVFNMDKVQAAPSAEQIAKVIEAQAINVRTDDELIDEAQAPRVKPKGIPPPRREAPALAMPEGFGEVTPTGVTQVKARPRLSAADKWTFGPSAVPRAGAR
jgi:hypothetical protein